MHESIGTRVRRALTIFDTTCVVIRAVAIWIAAVELVRVILGGVACWTEQAGASAFLSTALVEIQKATLRFFAEEEVGIELLYISIRTHITVALSDPQGAFV
jgi:hypothetical protein